MVAVLVSSTLAVALRPSSLSCLFSFLPRCFPPVCFLDLWVCFHFVIYIRFFYSLDFTYKCIEYLSFSIWPSISSVQSLSHVWLFVTPWIAAHQASLSITNSRSSLKLRSIKSVMPSSHPILCRPPFLLPPIPPSIISSNSIHIVSSQRISIFLWPSNTPLYVYVRYIISISIYLLIYSWVASIYWL